MTAVGEGSASGPMLRPAAPDARPSAATLARVALPELVELGVLAALVIAAAAVVVGLLGSYLGVRAETARLENKIARAGNVEGSLAERERDLARITGDLAQLEARVPDTLFVKALDSRLEYMPAQDHVTQVLSSPWTDSRVTLAGPLGQLDETRLDRSLDVRGKFADVLAFLADLESWPELVSIRDLRIRPPVGPKGEVVRGDVVGHFEISVHQIAREAKK